MNTLFQKAIDGHDESIYELMILHGKTFPESNLNKSWSGDAQQLRLYLKRLAKELYYEEEK